MIAIVDYNTGNLCSIRNAIRRIGADYILTDDEQQLRLADHVILPGVGAAAHAMEELRKRHLDVMIPTLTQPVLGICIGIQLLCQWSAEGDTPCLGVFDTQVTQLDAPKVPQMGWNTLDNPQGPIMTGIVDGTYVYYVHSFAPVLPTETSSTQLIATTTYGHSTFAAAMQRDRFYGTQFHPEKSGDIGESILKNFLTLC